MAENRKKEEEINEEIPITHKKKVDVQVQDDAGPSGSTPLPGAINIPRAPGLSKSEHSFCRITTKDLNNALKSISFGAAPPAAKINFQELKIPILDKEETPGKDDSTTLVDLKKFMASCFKFTKDTNALLGETANTHNISNRTIETNVATANVEASTNIDMSNKVIVTSGIEAKLSKVGADKKKTSGSISERSDIALAQRDSLSSIGSNVCRICMTRGRERLISPCNCKGSLANVHLSCLERWLNQVGRNHCELCGYSYPAIRTPRYTVLQALRLWFGNPRNRSHLQSDCLIFWLLSTVTAGLLAVCIVGTQYFVIEGNKFGKVNGAARKEEGISHRITETAMDFFMAIVLCGYSVTVYLLWKDHYVMWNRWRRANVNVRLLLTPDARPPPFTPPRRYIV